MSEVKCTKCGWQGEFDELFHDSNRECLCPDCHADASFHDDEFPKDESD